MKYFFKWVTNAHKNLKINKNKIEEAFSNLANMQTVWLICLCEIALVAVLHV